MDTNLVTAQGPDLNKIGELVGVKRGVPDINTLGDRILRFFGVSHTNVFGNNDDGTENPNDLYLRRYYIYRGKHRPHIYLHHIVRSDYERACHDHPWDFVSIILKGGYTEHNQCLETAFCAEHTHVIKKRAGSIVAHKAEDLHRLELERPAWTLVFSGRKRREWGFQTPDKGWIGWRELGRYIKDMME
jgi:hypothetical protein